jgi:hypothetical protein
MFKSFLFLAVLVSSAANAYIDQAGRVAQYHQSDKTIGTIYKLETLVRSFDSYAIMECESLERSRLSSQMSHMARQTDQFNLCMNKFYRFMLNELGDQNQRPPSSDHKVNFELYKLITEISGEIAQEHLQLEESRFVYLPAAQQQSAKKIRLLQLHLNVLELIEEQYNEF